MTMVHCCVSVHVVLDSKLLLRDHKILVHSGSHTCQVRYQGPPKANQIGYEFMGATTQVILILHQASLVVSDGNFNNVGLWNLNLF